MPFRGQLEVPLLPPPPLLASNNTVLQLPVHKAIHALKPPMQRKRPSHNTPGTRSDMHPIAAAACAQPHSCHQLLLWWRYSVVCWGWWSRPVRRSWWHCAWWWAVRVVHRWGEAWVPTCCTTSTTHRTHTAGQRVGKAGWKLHRQGCTLKMCPLPALLYCTATAQAFATHLAGPWPMVVAAA